MVLTLKAAKSSSNRQVCKAGGSRNAMMRRGRTLIKWRVNTKIPSHKRDNLRVLKRLKSSVKMMKAQVKRKTKTVMIKVMEMVSTFAVLGSYLIGYRLHPSCIVPGGQYPSMPFQMQQTPYGL